MTWYDAVGNDSIVAISAEDEQRTMKPVSFDLAFVKCLLVYRLNDGPGGCVNLLGCGQDEALYVMAAERINLCVTNSKLVKRRSYGEMPVVTLTLRRKPVGS